jgi:hypothetical protein
MAQKHLEESEASVTTGKPGRFQLSILNWILLGLAIVLQAVLLLAGSRGHFSDFILKAMVVNIGTLVVVPLVLSYLAWIFSGEKKIIGSVVFVLAILGTSAWMTSQHISVTRNLGPILDYSRKQLELRREYENDDQSPESRSALIQQMQALKLDLFNQLARKSEGPVGEFYGGFSDLLNRHSKLRSQFEELEARIFDENFIDYVALTNNSAAASLIQEVDQFMDVSRSLQAIPDESGKLVSDLKASSSSLGPVESTIVDKELEFSIAPLKAMDGFYKACLDFGASLKSLIEWLRDNPGAWTYDSGEQKMTLSTPTAQEEFTRQVMKAEMAANQLNTVASSIQAPAGSVDNEPSP